MSISCMNSECSNTFEGRKTRKYCSSTCSNFAKHKKAYQLTICAESSCNNEFEARISKNQRFCSQSCGNKSVPKRMLEGNCKTCAKKIPSSRTYCDDHKFFNHQRSDYLIERICKNLNCDNEFSTYNVITLFCSKNCNNEEYKRLNKKVFSNQTCLCGKTISRYAERCSPCFKEWEKQIRIDAWLKGKWNGGSETHLSKTIRLYLLEQSKYSCSSCGFNTMHPLDNKTVLEIDHIDGDGSNHKPNNLQVLCPNCHSLTPTYRNRNSGNGRKVSYLRVDKRIEKK